MGTRTASGARWRPRFEAVVYRRRIAAHPHRRLHLAPHGVQIDWTSDDTATVKGFALGGAVVAGVMAAICTRNLAGALLGVLAGGLAGAAIATTLVYRAAIHGTHDLRVVALELT